MATLGNDIGLLFKIKADSSDATRELNQVEGAIQNTSTGFAGLANPAAIAGAAIAAVGAAAVIAATGLYRLTKSTADYGAEIFDATEKTGLGAKAMSALKVAAEQSGSSFEGITSAVAKFNVLLGEAEAGNVKASKTLSDYGITATDTQGALEQAIKAIAQETNVTKQAAAAKALFKDRTADILPVIKSFDGDLPGLIDKLDKMGVLMSDKNAAAADAFGDQMDMLTLQIESVARTIGFELMPAFMSMATTVSGWLAKNQGEIANYASRVGALFDNLIRGFNKVKDWIVENSTYIRIAFGLASMGISELAIRGAQDSFKLLDVMSTPRAAAPGAEGAAGVRRFSPGFDPSDPRASGRRSREDNSAEREAERARREAEAAERERLAAIREGLRQEVAEKAANNEYLLSRLKADLEEGRITEEQAMIARQKIELEFLTFKIDVLEREKEAFKGYLEEEKRLTSEVKIANKQIEASLEDFRAENHAAAMKRLDEFIAKTKEEGRAILDNIKLEKERANRDRLRGPGDSGLYGGDVPQPVDLIEKTSIFRDTAVISGIDAMTSAFQSLGQAIGQVVQAWVLYGSAGASVRQVTAQILAGVAQQAAVKAIFELAEGFAALAMAFFGIPNAGPSASAHFTAAAIYGSIAGVAAVAGRGVAGNSFNQTAGSAGSGGVGAGNGASQQNNFTTRFNGFGNAMGEQIRQQNQVIAALEETITRFDRKFNTASPGAVVMAGANEASRAIVGALHSEYSDNPASVDGTMRNLGFAR